MEVFGGWRVRLVTMVCVEEGMVVPVIPDCIFCFMKEGSAVCLCT